MARGSNWCERAYRWYAEGPLREAQVGLLDMKRFDWPQELWQKSVFLLCEESDMLLPDGQGLNVSNVRLSKSGLVLPARLNEEQPDAVAQRLSASKWVS